MSKIEFVGGSMDGQTINGSLRRGTEWRAEGRAGEQVEIYVLDEDDRFRFNRRGLAFNLLADMPEVLEKLNPVFSELETVLAKLDRVLAEHGGPSAGDYGIGNWRIRHKDA